MNIVDSAICSAVKFLSFAFLLSGAFAGAAGLSWGVGEAVWACVPETHRAAHRNAAAKSERIKKVFSSRGVDSAVGEAGAEIVTRPKQNALSRKRLAPSLTHELIDANYRRP